MAISPVVSLRLAMLRAEARCMSNREARVIEMARTIRNYERVQAERVPTCALSVIGYFMLLRYFSSYTR